MTCESAPAPSVQQCHHARHGEAGPAEHVAPPEPDRVATVLAQVEVPVEIPVALTCGVVVHPTVELDDESAVELHVAVDHTFPDAVAHLSSGSVDAVPPLDDELAMLQHRAPASTSALRGEG